jgi:hypothetical protein
MELQTSAITHDVDENLDLILGVKLGHYSGSDAAIKKRQLALPQLETILRDSGHVC